MDTVVLADRPTWSLVAIAVAAIALLLVLIIEVRLHALFSLVVVSVLTGLAAGIGVGDVIAVVVDGFGTPVGSVALLVGFGAVLGRLVEMTGGAQVLADEMLDTFGEERAPLALALTPPHPGPTAAATVMGADLGLVVLVAPLVGLPTWYLAGYRLGLAIARRYPDVPVPTLLGEPEKHAEEELPRFGTVILVLLLPLVPIFFNTIFSTLEANGTVSADSFAYGLPRLVGTTGRWPC